MAKYKLGEICEIVSGSTPKTGIAEYWDGNLKWITPAEIDDESYIITDSARKLTELGVKKTGLSSFPSGTVILSSRAPIGKVAIAGCEMYCNQGFKNLICSDRINNRYLYWFLKGNTANVSTPNLDYVWEQRKKDGRYSFYINRKHSLLNTIKKQLDEQGKKTLFAYLSLVENFAPFMMSGVTDSLQKGKNNATFDKTSLEYQIQIKELEDMIKIFMSQGFTKDEIQSTLLDMANYRHLRDDIIRLVGEAQ